MAKMTFEFDTVEKTLSAKMDGKDIPNLMAVRLYNSQMYSMDEADEENEYRCELSMCQTDKENSTKTYTSVIASENGFIKQNIPAEEILKREIASYLES